MNLVEKLKSKSFEVKPSSDEEEVLKYDILIFGRQDPAIEFQTKHPEYRLLMAQDYYKSASKRYLIAKWDFWFKEFADISFQHGAWFYEILKKEEPCKLYLDIDGDDQLDVKNMMDNTIPSMCKELTSTLGYEVKIPTLLQACSEKKRSFHLIFNDVICDGTFSAGELVKRHLAKFPYVDDSVYGKRRCFRLCNSSKSGKKRPFTKCNENDATEDTYATIKDLTDITINFDEKPVEEKYVASVRKLRTELGINVPEEEIPLVKDYVEYLKIHHYKDMAIVGEIRKVDDKYIMKAKNIECPNIGRFHKNNNVFITIIEKKADTLCMGTNVSEIYVRCADPDCRLASVINHIKVV